MDYEEEKDGSGSLTAGKTATSKLVAVVVLVAVMGISQSGLFLSLARAGLDLQDEILEFLIRYLAYADDLHSGVTAQEVLNLQTELFPFTPWHKLKERWNDKICCPPTVARTSAAGWAPPPRADRTPPAGWTTPGGQAPPPERTSTMGWAPPPGAG